MGLSTEVFLAVLTTVLTGVAAIWSLSAAVRARREAGRRASTYQDMLKRLTAAHGESRPTDIRITTTDGRHYAIELSRPGMTLRKPVSTHDVERIAEILTGSGAAPIQEPG